MMYFIRTWAAVAPEHFQAPRTPDTVRRSLDGTLCVLAFDPGTAPKDWADGLDAKAVDALLNAEGSEGVWWVPE